MPGVAILFPHQLFRNHTFLENCKKVYLLEEYLFFEQYAFHQQKIAFHRASMKAYADYLQSLNKEVVYIDAKEQIADIRYFKCSETKDVTLHYIDPEDQWLHKRLRQMAHQQEIALKMHPNPMFLKKEIEVKGFFRSDKKKYSHAIFYKQERSRSKILMDNQGQPIGGKWSFDADNRKKFPKKSIPPSVSLPEADSYWTEALAYVSCNYSNNPGKIGHQPLYPYTHTSAESWLHQFLEHRFYAFGDYEDAIVSENSLLHHSLISPLLNAGLLDIEQVLDAVLKHAQAHEIPLNSLEGFIRQIIGWREFIRGMYRTKGGFMRSHNFWNFTRPIPCSFYDGTTGILPLDNTIHKVLETGYCHHIERLMVLGNFMLLCEFDPNAVYQWFMELFIDAYDWVMVPNVYGMSQFADGGTFATKPYISGSNYILKMSHYKKGPWQASWDGLFWSFMDKHRHVFLKNPRLSMLIRSFDKWPDSKKHQYRQQAADFINAQF